MATSASAAEEEEQDHEQRADLADPEAETTDLFDELALDPTRGDLNHVPSSLHSGLVHQFRQRAWAPSGPSLSLSASGIAMISRGVTTTNTTITIMISRGTIVMGGSFGGRSPRLRFGKYTGEIDVANDGAPDADRQPVAGNERHRRARSEVTDIYRRALGIDDPVLSAP